MLPSICNDLIRTHSAAELSGGANGVANGEESAVVNGHTEEGSSEQQPDGVEVGKPGDQDIVLIQDAGFLIKIQVPGLEAFDLPVRRHSRNSAATQRQRWHYF